MDEKLSVLILEGPNKGLFQDIKDFPIRIGRLDENDLILNDDQYVSRYHCIIFLKNYSYFIKDLGSTHGTYINGIKINDEQKLDTYKDVINVGKTTVIFTEKKQEQLNYETMKDNKIINLIASKSILIPSMKLEKGKNEALLVIDICKSTEFINTYGDTNFYNFLLTIAKIFEHKSQQYNIQFLKCTGDGFFVTYKEARQAIDISLYLLKKLTYLFKDYKGFVYPGVRIGLHFGNVIENSDGDRVGRDAHLTFRLEGATQKELTNPSDDLPGLKDKDRILITDILYNMITDEELKQKFKYCGDYLFKGFDDGVGVYCYNSD